MPISAEAAFDWKSLYEAALLESVPSKVVDRIMAARNAIFDRVEATLCNPAPSEHREMNDALHNLHRLIEVTTAKVAAY